MLHGKFNVRKKVGIGYEIHATERVSFKNKYVYNPLRKTNHSIYNHKQGMFLQAVLNCDFYKAYIMYFFFFFFNEYPPKCSQALYIIFV